MFLGICITDKNFPVKDKIIKFNFLLILLPYIILSKEKTSLVLRKTKGSIKMKKLLENKPLNSKIQPNTENHQGSDALYLMWRKNAHTLEMLSTELQRAGYGRIAPDIIDTIRETFKTNPLTENMFPKAVSEALKLIRHEVHLAIDAYRSTQKSDNITSITNNTKQRLKETITMYQAVSKAFYKIAG